MTNEAIEKIKAAEKAAADLAADARKKAAEMRADAEKGAADAQKAATDKAAALLREAEENAAKKADGIIDSGVNSARVEATRMVADAAHNTDAASDEIIRGIFEKWQ